LLPELLQNAIAWKLVHTQSPTPYTQEAYQPYRQLLEAFGAGLTDAGLTDAGLTDAGLTDAGLTDAGLTDAGERLWFENALRFLQDVRSPRTLLRTSIQEDDDLGLSFVAWEPFHLDPNRPALKALVEWVEQTGVVPPKEGSEGKESDAERFDRVSSASFRLCMWLTLDLDHAHRGYKRCGPPWEQLHRLDPVVWQLVLGDRAYAHMKYFFEHAFLPGIQALSTCIQTMLDPIVQVTKRLQVKTDGRIILPNDLLRGLKENMECCKHVFEAVVTTKAECWKRMTMYLDQGEHIFTALLPNELRKLCEEIDLRMYYFLCYGDETISPPLSKEWKDLFALVPLPSCAEVDDLGPDDTQDLEFERTREQKEKEREQSLVMCFGEPSDRQDRMVSDWKQGKLGTGTFLDGWYAFFVETLPVECLAQRRRLGHLFPTFTHLRLMGEV